MKLNPTQQESLVRLMAQLYDNILALETEYQLVAGGADMRPRIDYFHDAIRAFTSRNARARDPGGRLTIEWLSYDVAALRYIEAMPLASLSPFANLSPSTSMVEVKEGLVPQKRRATREAKEALSEGYKKYGVLFAALLKPFADSDFHERTELLDEEIVQINQLIASMESGSNIAAHIQHLDDEQLRQMLTQLMNSGGMKKPEALKKAIHQLKQKIKNTDKDIKIIDKAHHDYAMNQLGLYEASRDTLKQMAQAGMNLVGQFVEASIRNNPQGRGR